MTLFQVDKNRPVAAAFTHGPIVDTQNSRFSTTYFRVAANDSKQCATAGGHCQFVGQASASLTAGHLRDVVQTRQQAIGSSLVWLEKASYSLAERLLVT